LEGGGITYKHNVSLDTACHEEIKQCHMMILIIGGRYSSKSTQEDQEYISEYEEKYMSFTRKGLKTALKQNMPIYIFVEKSVHADYRTFMKNEKMFHGLVESSTDELKKIYNEWEFAHVDSINIFDFIREVYNTGMVIHDFENYDDIENVLQNQWADLIYKYLEGLQQDKKEAVILDSVSEVKELSTQMNTMIQKVAEKVLPANDYKTVINNQKFATLDSMANKISTLEFFNEGTMSIGQWEQVSKAFIDNLLLADWLTDETGWNILKINDVYDALSKELVDGVKFELTSHKLNLLRDMISDEFSELIGSNKTNAKHLKNQLALAFSRNCNTF